MILTCLGVPIPNVVIQLVDGNEDLICDHPIVTKYIKSKPSAKYTLRLSIISGNGDSVSLVNKHMHDIVPVESAVLRKVKLGVLCVLYTAGKYC